MKAYWGLLAVLLTGCGGTVQSNPSPEQCFVDHGCEVMAMCEPSPEMGCQLEAGGIAACWPKDGTGGCWTQTENGQDVALWTCPTSYNGQCE